MSWPDKAWNRIEFSEETCAEVRRLYLEERLSAREVGKQVGCSLQRAMREIHEKGYAKTRKEQKYDAAVKGLGQNNGVDLDFLRSWSEGSAWVWGVWFGDGWLSTKGLHFGFSGDLSVILRIKDLIATRAKPYQAKKIKKKEQGWRLEIGSLSVAILIKEKFALSPGRKSRIIQWPEMPVGLERHFIRGLWDSDGSWCFFRDKRYPEKIYLQGCFSSMSGDIVESVSRKISFHCGLPIKKVEQQGKKGKKDGCFVIRYASTDSRKIGNWLYSNANASDRSERKYDRWVQLLGPERQLNRGPQPK